MKGIVALLMLAVLLFPMYAGLRRIRRLPPPSREEAGERADAVVIEP